MTTISPVNYQDYPECMFAMVAAFLPANEAELFREVTGKVCFRHQDSQGKTYKNGVLHSYEDQPAVSTATYKIWYKDGKIHRDGGQPAYIDSECTEWYKEGKLHRESLSGEPDLPAVIRGEFNLQWWVNGVRHRKGDLPAVIFENRQEWWVNGLRHRDEDKPAYIEPFLYKWYKNGVLHRDDGPAYMDGTRNMWYRNGEMLCILYN